MESVWIAQSVGSELRLPTDGQGYPSLRVKTRTNLVGVGFPNDPQKICAPQQNNTEVVPYTHRGVPIKPMK